MRARAVVLLAVVVAVVTLLLALRPADDGGPPGAGGRSAGPARKDGGTALPADPASDAAAPVAPEGSILVRVLAEGGRPADLVEVGAGIAAEGVVVPGTRTGEGRFRVDGLDPGRRYRVAARAAGCAPAVVGGIAPGGPEVTLVVQPGFLLHGVVEDEAGAAVPGATVRLTGVVPGLREDETRVEVGVDEAGRFRFVGVPRVPYRLEAGEGRGDWVEEGPGLPPVEGDEVFVRFELPSGGVVAGRVLSPDGRPLAGIEVTATPADARAWPSTVTGADGVFLLRPGPGPCTLEARDTTGLDAWTAASGIPATAPARGLEIRLEPGTTPRAGIRARWVVDDPGRFTALAWCVAQPDGTVLRSGYGRGTQDEEFRQGACPPGAATLFAASPVGWARVEGLSLAAGVEADLGEVRLLPGVTVRGRFATADGGVPGGVAILVPPLTTPWHEPPGADGRFEVGVLPPGEGSLILHDGIHETATVRWNAGAGAVVELEPVRLVPGTGTVAVTVRSRDGKPLPASLRAELRPAPPLPPAPDGRILPVGPGGRVEFRGVPAGEWFARVTVGGDNFRSGRSSPSIRVETGGKSAAEVAW